MLPRIRASYHPADTAPPHTERPQDRESIIPFFAQDVSFLLDQLAELNRADPRGILSGRLDLQRTGVFGVSLGGIVAAEACRRDARLRACLMLDAPMPTDVVQARLSQASLWFTRPPEDMRLERQRSGGWPEEKIALHQNSMRATFAHLAGAGYLVQISGTFHSNFTDLPRWSPLLPGWVSAGRLIVSGRSTPIRWRSSTGTFGACQLRFWMGRSHRFPKYTWSTGRARTSVAQ